MTLIIETLLPEPDSPTIPTTSPGFTVNETPSTARTSPSSVRNDTRRSLTSSSGSAMAQHLLDGTDARVEERIHHVHQRVCDDDEEGAVDDRRHDHREIETGQRLIGQIADARQPEHDLREQRPAAHERAEVEPEEAHEGDHRGAQH